ncbi:unnamed protein product [Rotaria sp. Silwood1]|nr:unnamed protein product [Rotaria sp. Silwood1]
MSSAFDGLLFLQSSNDGSNLITVRLHYVIITAIYNLMDPNRAATWQYRKHHVQDLHRSCSSSCYASHHSCDCGCHASRRSCSTVCCASHRSCSSSCYASRRSCDCGCYASRCSCSAVCCASHRGCDCGYHASRRSCSTVCCASHRSCECGCYASRRSCSTVCCPGCDNRRAYHCNLCERWETSCLGCKGDWDASSCRSHGCCC